METLARELMKRSEKAFSRLRLYQDLYEAAFRLGAPHRNGFTVSEGNKQYREVYDSTFADSWERLVNSLAIGMCPDSSRWYEYVPGREVPDGEKEEIELLLKKHADKTFDVLDASNYYTELQPVLTDLIAGTCAMVIDEDLDQPGTPSFRSVALGEYAIEPGIRGTVGGFFWPRKVLGRLIEREFPNADLPPDLIETCKNNPDEEHRILTCTIPETYFDRTHAQYVIWEPTHRILEKRRFFENPVAVARWHTLSGEVMGRGPALKAEPNAYSGNELSKLALIAANIATFGMWIASHEAVNVDTIELGASKVIPVDAQGQDVAYAMRPLVPGIRYDFAQANLAENRSHVQRNLYRDQLGDVGGPRMTATEVIERQKLVAMDLGAAYSRIKGELLIPVLRRVTGIAGRRGKTASISLDGKLVGVRFTSALARAMRFEEAAAIRALRDDVIAMKEIDPGAGFMFDGHRAARRLAIITGVDPETIRSEDEAAELAMQYGQAQGAMAQAGQGMAGQGMPG